VACSRDRGCNDHRILRRASCRRKASRIGTRRLGHATRSRSISALRSHSPTRVPRPKADGTVTMQPSRRRGRRRRRRSATGVSEVRSRSAPWEENAHAHDERSSREVLVSTVTRRSGPGRRETSGSPGPCRTEPKTPWGVHAAKAAERAGNERGAGPRSSYGWQKSVGRIARLRHRWFRKVRWCPRALARKKSGAPSDAGRGGTEGETVRVCEASQHVASRTACGFTLAGSRYDGRRSRALARPAFTGRRREGPLTRRSTPVALFPQGTRDTASASGDGIVDSGVPASDDGNVRGRRGLVKALQGRRTSAGSPHPRR